MSAAPNFRESAAVMVVRDGAKGLEVFLVQRSAQLRFFGGYWALPGGVRDRRADGGFEPFSHCAARELLEETGLLIHDWRAELRQSTFEVWRRELLSDDDNSKWSQATRALADPESLIPLGAMQTPAFAPVRYHTEFYAYKASFEDPLRVLPGELSAGEFVSPQQILREWKRGERLVVPPVRTLLQMLGESDWEAFLAETPVRLQSYLDGRLPPILNTPGIGMLPLRTPTIPPATTTNHYLVGERDLYLVDPGTPYEDEQQRLIQHIEERISAGCHFQGILLTHRHHDHVGGLGVMEEHFDVPVYAHPHTLQNLPVSVRRPRTLEDGQRIGLGMAPDGTREWHLEVITTPGHAAGHVVFQDSRYGAVIGGDLASTVSTILIEPPEGHLATYLESLRKVIHRRPTLFYPAHGPVARDGVALLEKYLAHRAKRELGLLRALELLEGSLSVGRSVEALVPDVYPELDPAMYPFAEQSMLAGLIKLEEEGRAVCLGGLWRVADTSV